ncbi:hypothetical protein V6N11_033812 [Hibiscus sabdariffa]|uniref:Uncharacterized protein n=1 Tax=Hibiscus sabdariffa TaxID=183260 RepID=A0ABR2S0H2_9ROSI
MDRVGSTFCIGDGCGVVAVRGGRAELSRASSVMAELPGAGEGAGTSVFADCVGVGIAIWIGTASVRSILRMYSFRVQLNRIGVYLSV